jgi:iron(III) transport system substrate-binding protein
MRTRRRCGVAVALVALSIATVTACGGGAPEVSPADEATSPGWSEVVSNAVAEGTVIMYTPYLQNQQDALQAAFSAKYPGIQLQMVRQLQGVQAKLDAEKQTGSAGADVVVTNDPSLGEGLRTRGDLLAIDGPSTDLWTGNSYFAAGAYFTSTLNTLGLAWNTDLVTQPIASYADLLRPELAGRIGLVEVTGTPAIVDFYQFLEESQGPDFLARLAAQRPTFYPSTVPLQQAVIAGEVSVGGYVVPAVRDEKANGAPVDFALPQPAWAAPFDAFAVGWSQHPHAARVLLDFMMSREGQAALAIDGTSALPGVDVLTPLDQVRPSEVATLTPDAVSQYAARWRGIFGR